MVTPTRFRIGDVLIDSGLISDEQLKKALELQKDRGGKLGDLVVQLGFITEKDFLRALSNQFHMPLIELEHFTIKREIACSLPERIARRHRVLVLDKISNQYLIGMADPTDVQAYDEVHQILKSSIKVAIVRESSILKTIDQIYRRTDDIASFAVELSEELLRDSDIPEEASQTANMAPVVKLLESIFEDAVQVGASDIHIEPDENVLRIRQRIDGVLHEELIEEKQIVNALVLRIKLMAKMNISERRLPQDGRFRLHVKDRDIDVRVSTMPIRNGESVVMRLLDQSQGLLSLDQIDLRPEVLKRLSFHIKRPNGLILVTGPTGSGKTTTLYSILNELNDIEKKIITIEDPVEYTISRINQVQVNPTIDLTFARVLRTALRQDPEIVMIGEMRDEETARIGLRAAMTGHLVLSTLHTNDAISSAVRLIDMGVEGYLVAAALKVIIAQRLIRKNCDSCSEASEPTDKEREILEVMLNGIDQKWEFKRGKGCSNCNRTGYSGRIGIHELLEINTTLADKLRQNDAAGFAESARSQPNYKPLVLAAFEHALEGNTTVEEVFRIAGELEEVNKE